MNPLDGITVVALEHAVAAPFATRQLADLGARVIKVERPGVGDFARGYDRSVHGQSSYFLWLNRGKQSLELDIKDSSDRELLDRLIAHADVFVHNLVPGAVERLKLDADTIRAARPELIHCSISGYGSDGPYRQKKAYDLLVQCETGLLETTGTPRDRVKAGISIADIATGMYAYAGVLAALYDRQRTGVGSTLEVAMIDALGEWMVQPTYFTVYGNQPPRRTGARHASIAPYGPYRSGDGSTIFLGVQSDREWALLCRTILRRTELIKDLRFAHNPDRVEHDEELTAIIEAAIADLPGERVLESLEQAGIACARLRTPAEFFDHPQLRARQRWRQVETPGGPVQALLPPVDIRGHDPLVHPVPALGHHNSAIRAEFAPITQWKIATKPKDRAVSDTIERTELLLRGPAQALAAVLGVPLPDLDISTGLPLAWHWLYLHERPAQADLGPDGHPIRGTIPTPPASGLRRMWAGGQIHLLAPLRCGEPTTRRTTVLSTQNKHGRSGPFILVTVGHQITQAGRLVIDERQDLVYRPPTPPQADPPPAMATTTAIPPAPDEWAIETTPTLLFQFSALTYNAHRIHYDRYYAQHTEGYPGLLVHGPLQALAMAEAARINGASVEGGLRYEYRLIAPLFDSQGLIARATSDNGQIRTAVRDRSGRQTAIGTITLG